MNTTHTAVLVVTFDEAGSEVDLFTKEPEMRGKAPVAVSTSTDEGRHGDSRLLEGDLERE